MENMPTYVGVTRVKKHVFKSEYTLHSNLFFQFSFNNFTKFCCIGQAPSLINLWKVRHRTPLKDNSEIDALSFSYQISSIRLDYEKQGWILEVTMVNKDKSWVE